MGYIVINDARQDDERESDELLDLDAALELASDQRRKSDAPLRVVQAETGRTLLYFGHTGYRCINRAGSGRVYQLDGGFSRPCENLETAIAQAAKEYLSCIARGADAEIEVVDGKGRVYWRNGRPV